VPNAAVNYPGYTINTAAASPTDRDINVQKITVTITKTLKIRTYLKTITFILEGYKTNR